MFKYFSNPELKRSSAIILILAFITLSCSFFVINKGYEQMRISYIESNTAIVGELVKNHPQLKDEIIPLVTKGANEKSIEQGKKILDEYGYNESLNIEFIPAMKKSYTAVLNWILILIICFSTVAFVGNCIQYKIIYKRLEKLIIGAQNILEYNFDIGIYENAEGTFAKLAHAFNNMRIIMKNNLGAVQKEKQFLVDTLSDISHQLKTPIASLIIYNDILLERKLDEEKRKEFLKSSGNQLNRIEWLVKSLLKLAKLDAGVIKFEKEDYDINKTVEEAVETLAVKAKQEGINLIFKNRNSEIIMKHDPNWLSECFINIIKNALEHTDNGGSVTVFTERTPVCVRVIVQDSGEGISKEDIPNIFKRFYKGKRSKNTESVGIGLALSKSIVEGHEGMIEVKSKEKEGTTFTITFLNSI